MVDLGLNVTPEPTWPGKAEADAFRGGQNAAKRPKELRPDSALFWIDVAEAISWIVTAFAVLSGLVILSAGGEAIAIGAAVAFGPVTTTLVVMAVLESLRFIIRKMDEYE